MYRVGAFLLECRAYTEKNYTTPMVHCFVLNLFLASFYAPPYFFKFFLFLSHVFIIHTVLLYHMWGGDMNI